MKYQDGFIISPNKTKAIIFTKKKLNSNTKTYLKINNTTSEVVDNIKFLGLHFDNKLNWNTHIDYIVAKCKKSLNLIRSLTSHKWGSNKKVLLIVYNSLIKSRMLYGSEIFHTASKKSLKKLDTLQYEALRICSGAIKGTPLAALPQECGRLPLSIERNKILYRHAN